MDVKGTALSSMPAYVADTFGKDGFSDWLRALPDDSRELYRYPIKRDVWYPLVRMLSLPTRIMCDLFFKGSLEGAWAAGRYSADVALHGIYRLFVKMGSVESLIARASVILPTYYRPSSLRVVSAERGRVVLSIDQFPDLDEIIETRISGWIHRAVEISGQNDVAVSIVKSLVRGDDATEFNITWK